MPSKTFISHSSEDKPWVLPFATRLRTAGVDAFVDVWEIAAGDSLVQKIHEEGLGQSDSVIVVLSENSTASRWVKEEMEVATARRIQEDCRVIPVVLDDCEKPNSMKHLRWVKIKDRDSYDTEFQDIVNSVFGVNTKPPLGEPPAIVNTSPLPGISKLDSRLFRGICEAVLEHDQTRASFHWHVKDGQYPQFDMTVQDVWDSCEMLQNAGYLVIDPMVGAWDVEVTTFGQCQHWTETVPGFAKVYDDIAALIVNEHKETLADICEATGHKPAVIRSLLCLMEADGLIGTIRHSSGTDIQTVSARLRRHLTHPE